MNKLEVDKMKFEDALKKLKAEECQGILPADSSLEGMYTINGDGIIQYKEEQNWYFDVHLSVDNFLGEWELVKPVKRPVSGEVWEIWNEAKKEAKKYFIYLNSDSSIAPGLFGIDSDGNIIVITKDMWEGNGGFVLWPTERGSKDES